MISIGHGKKNKWEKGPSVVASDFSTGDGIIAGLGVLLAMKKGGVGIIFHSADCSVLNSVKDVYDTPEKMAQVRTLCQENPGAVILGDVAGVVEGNRWRPIVVSGAKKGRYALFRLSLRDIAAGLKIAQLDGSFSVAVRSAHMEALTVGQALAGVFEGDEQIGEGAGRVLVYYYRRNTMIAVYNPQGGMTELRLLPQNEGGVPQTLKNDFSLILQKSEAANMLVTVFQCADGVEALAEELGAIKSVPGVNVTLQILERHAFAEFCKSGGLALGAPEDGGFVPIEFAIESQEWLLSHSITGKADELTMMDMATSDYAKAGIEEEASLPTPSDLKMFLAGRALQVLVFLGCVGLGLFSAFSVWKMMQTTEWGVDLVKAQKIAEKVDGLEAEKAKVKDVKKILLPKADGRFALELVLALFPSEEGKLTQLNFTYKTPEERGTGQGGGKTPGQKGTVAKTLMLSFSGKASDRGVAMLNRLRNEKVLSNLIKEAGMAAGLEELNIVGTPVIAFSERSQDDGPSTGDGGKEAMGPHYTFAFSGTLNIDFGEPKDDSDIKKGGKTK